jgi:hypothetical protein
MSETNLYITLNEQDAKLLAAAVPEGLARRDALGIVKADTLAHVALGAVCQAILGGGYRPRPVAAHLRREDPGTAPALPENTIKVQLA